MFNSDKGKLAIVLKDCRENSPAKGRYGICEGNFPVGWNYSGPNGKPSGECLYTPENEKILREKYGFILIEELGDRVAQILLEQHDIALPLLEGISKEEERHASSLYSQTFDELRKTTGIYFEHTNPRIRLEDGSVIWGYECWWKPLDAKVSDDRLSEVLESGEADIKRFCEVLNSLLALHEQVEQQESLINE